MTRRFLILRLPRLAVERRFSRCDAPAKGVPHATIETVGNAVRLVAVDRAAAAAGLEPGLTLADARARVPALKTLPHDADGDWQALLALAEWAGRYTPLVAPDPPPGGARSPQAAGVPAGLALDITGCAHLFGGEAGMLADIVARIERRGLTVRAAIADSPAAARAVARAAPGTVVPPGGNAAALGHLPVADLEAAPGTIAALERLGLKRIGQIAGLPRASLAARFGEDLLVRLDRALGRADEPLSPLRPPPLFVAERVLAEPIRLVEHIERVVGALGESLAGSLARHGRGARRLALTLYRLDGTALRVTAGLSRASRDPEQMAGLVCQRLGTFESGLDTGEGIEVVRLAAEAVDVLDAEQTVRIGAEEAAGGGEAAGGEALDRLADRLAARLGRDRVVRLVRRDSHIPELATVAVPAVEGTSAGGRGAEAAGAGILPAWPEAPRPGRAPERPLRLLERPEPIETIAEVPDGPPVRFRWRRVLREVACLEGPERIAPEWWVPERLQGEADALTRDYFRVEDTDGRRYWVFRAGLYGRETAAPRWYLHGLFG